MRITMSMVRKAEREHHRKEDVKSMNKYYALKSLYYKQRGDYKTAKAYGKFKDIKPLIKKLESKSQRKISRKISRSPRRTFNLWDDKWLKEY